MRESKKDLMQFVPLKTCEQLLGGHEYPLTPQQFARALRVAFDDRERARLADMVLDFVDGGAS
jgi:hypothetical protein